MISRGTPSCIPVSDPIFVPNAAGSSLGAMRWHATTKAPVAAQVAEPVWVATEATMTAKVMSPWRESCMVNPRPWTMSREMTKPLEFVVKLLQETTIWKTLITLPDFRVHTLLSKVGPQEV